LFNLGLNQGDDILNTIMGMISLPNPGGENGLNSDREKKKKFNNITFDYK